MHEASKALQLHQEKTIKDFRLGKKIAATLLPHQFTAFHQDDSLYRMSAAQRGRPTPLYI